MNMSIQKNQTTLSFKGAGSGRMIKISRDVEKFIEAKNIKTVTATEQDGQRGVSILFKSYLNKGRENNGLPERFETLVVEKVWDRLFLPNLDATRVADIVSMAKTTTGDALSVYG